MTRNSLKGKTPDEKREYYRQYYLNHRGLGRKRIIDRSISSKWSDEERLEHRRNKLKEYRITHPEYGHNYYINNLEHERERSRVKSKAERIRRRKELLAFLGGKCVRCGFSDWRALQIDHVDGHGKDHRRELGSKFSSQFRKEVMTDTTGKYQLLCANCNWIKREENDENRKQRKILVT
jgi:hypothetical protein